MVANGTARSMPAITTPLHAGTPRANSSLSHVTYPSAYAPSPVVQVPRSYSYNHAAYAATDRTGDGVYTPVEQVGPPSPAVQMPRSYSYNHAAYAANDRAGDGVYAPVEQVGLSFKGKEAVDRPPRSGFGPGKSGFKQRYVPPPRFAVSQRRRGLLTSMGAELPSQQQQLGRLDQQFSGRPRDKPARSGLRRNTDLLWAARATDMAGAGEGRAASPPLPPETAPLGSPSDHERRHYVSASRVVLPTLILVGAPFSVSVCQVFAKLPTGTGTGPAAHAHGPYGATSASRCPIYLIYGERCTQRRPFSRFWNHGSAARRGLCSASPDVES